MASSNVLGWLTGRGLAAGPNNGDFLLATRHFQAALRRERLRSDRSLTGFSLLTIALSRRGATNDALRVASDVLEQRIRETDQAGWFKDRTIGVILPDTPANGAWKLAEDVRDLLAQRHVATKFHVYVYPTFDAGDRESGVDRHGIGKKNVAAAQPLESLFFEKLPTWKRAMDIVGAGIGLVVVGPIMVAVALAIKLTSRGPVLFVQDRHGLGGREFAIFKFRTMIVNAEELKSGLRGSSEQDGPAFKLKCDPRVTRLGSFLRRTSIDELPQLFNILKGEMSLVGPRPLPCDESAACEPWQKQRLSVTPGLTCIWQVKGRSRVSFTEWMRMDLEYVRSRSLRHDLKLLLQTVHAVLLRKGAC